MVRLGITISFRKESLVNDLVRKISEIEAKMSETVMAILMVFQDLAKEYAPKATGATADSIEIEYHGLSGSLYSPLETFSYIILGVPPHKIKAIPNSALYWDGAITPVKYVEHPGTPPHDFMAEAYMDGMYEAERLINDFGDWLSS